MLVLTRKVGERILIGDDIVLTILDSRGDGIRVGIDAPRGIKVQREEVVRAVTEANVEAASAGDEAEAQIRDLLGGAAPADPADDAPSQS
ncbi:carbon storage regulator CsrA [Frondihabitans sp. PAMC 28766]|uniref:carbon storage regulator n=1 Tax=Frondihabitans sp. PAMC 28766 TaxID=1795630 RepID=UPI00078BEF21|nr:carbon storage regulator [Frondihabitans sp. PAMC 28766]AMM19719.1 carbon storage regulator CsrA [Frondihabitans sp. PAMC 28766]